MQHAVKKTGLHLATAIALAFGCTSAVQAAAVYWTDWTSTSAASSQVFGDLDVGGTNVGITFTGAYAFAQTTGGTNYWSPAAPYLSSLVGNAPPASDIIGLNTGGKATITFSQAVVDPLIALVSWNGNTVDFGVPIEFLSYGSGYWDNGTPVMNSTDTGFYGNGEVHGVIRLPGTYSSVTFTHTSENWHGFTVGAVALGNGNPVPEPGSAALISLALFTLGATLRKRRS
ncbi:MAG: PEP-CTERM sorting domain-containing protein [Proteobacteria bacterium]|nr:PEP-CTERM sorting domain-containing protein [Pseudomonadota bacterium]